MDAVGLTTQGTAPARSRPFREAMLTAYCYSLLGSITSPPDVLLAVSSRQLSPKEY